MQMEKHRDKYSQQESKDGDENKEKLNIHPLLIDHVLDKIFDLIINDQISSSSTRTEDLRSVRLVCKLWRDRATSLFRQKEYSLDLMSLVVAKSERMVAMERFLDVMENSAIMPYRKFCIDPASVCEYKPELMLKFVRICLPKTVSLTIKYTDLNSSEWTQERSTKFNCRILEHLFVWVDPDLNVEESEEFIPFTFPHSSHPPLLQHILNSAINLESFNFGQSPGSYKPVMSEICKHIPKSVQFLTLKNFLFSEKCLRYLIKAKFRLKSLIISFYYSDCSNATICEFFKQQSETLTTLRLESILMLIGATNLLPPRFPKLEKVRELFLSGVPNDFGAPVPLSEIFPAVASLIVSEFKRREFWEGLKSVPTLKDLYLPNYFQSQNLIKKVSESFPNLNKLRVNFEMAETLTQFFTHCVKIEELVISSYNEIVTYKDIDCVLSGIDGNSYQEIQTENDYDKIDLESFAREVSILNLTKLKKLSLWGWPFRNVSKFLCHFVLIKMRDLESLHIMDFTANSIGHRYKTLLSTKLRISVSDPKDSHINFLKRCSKMDWT